MAAPYGKGADMGGACKTGQSRSGQLRHVLLVCFVIGLLAGSALLVQEWALRDVGPSLAAALVSALLLYTLIHRLMLRDLRSDLEDLGCRVGASAGFGALRGADQLLIDDAVVLRRAERSLAGQQPHLDPRLSPVILALAKHSDHPLALPLTEFLEAGWVVPDTITHVDVLPSGQVNAVWRAHRVSLFAQPISYGDLKLSMHLRVDGEAAATVVFDENIRPDAAVMVDGLKRLGITPMLLARDRTQLLGPMARQLSIMVQGCHDDEEKKDAVHRHIAAGRTALILSAAGEQLGWGLRAALQGDMLLQGQALGSVGEAISLVRKSCAARRHALATIALSHSIAWPLMVMGLPHPWVLVPAWAVCGIAVRQDTRRRAAPHLRAASEKAGLGAR
jgi:hypothetical protein